MPDIAAVLASMYAIPAHELPVPVFAPFGRLMDKMGIRPDLVRPFTMDNVAEVTEARLRVVMTSLVIPVIPAGKPGGKDSSDDE